MLDHRAGRLHPSSTSISDGGVPAAGPVRSARKRTIILLFGYTRRDTRVYVASLVRSVDFVRVFCACVASRAG
eukprot:2177413-Prymnesium_polylepis.1